MINFSLYHTPVTIVNYNGPKIDLTHLCGPKDCQLDVESKKKIGISDSSNENCQFHKRYSLP